MTWKPYALDECAQKIVSDAISRDPGRKSLNQIFKMRTTCAYGLERFWGEYLRLAGGNDLDRNKSKIILDTWKSFNQVVLSEIGIILSSDLENFNCSDPESVESSLRELWQIRTGNPKEAQLLLAVLASFCDAIIWWKNRLAPSSPQEEV